MPLMQYNANLNASGIRTLRWMILNPMHLLFQYDASSGSKPPQRRDHEALATLKAGFFKTFRGYVVVYDTMPSLAR